jgi:hypothetical protein
MKGRYEIRPLVRSEVPAEVLKIVEAGCSITAMNRYWACSPTAEVAVGFAFVTDKGTVVLIQDGCTLRSVPAWGVMTLTAEGADPIGVAVSGMYCHKVVKVGFFGHNVAKPQNA